MSPTLPTLYQQLEETVTDPDLLAARAALENVEALPITVFAPGSINWEASPRPHSLDRGEMGEST